MTEDERAAMDKARQTGERNAFLRGFEAGLAHERAILQAATRDAPTDVWTVIAPDGRKWQDTSIARAALHARFATGDIKEMLNNIQTALSDVPDTEPGQCVHCGHIEAATSDAPSADAVDAQRYRWLRRGEALKVRVPVKDKHVTYCMSARWESEFPEAFDAAIDKAIAASAPKGDGND